MLAIFKRWVAARRARKVRLPAPQRHAIVHNSREMKSLFRYKR